MANKDQPRRWIDSDSEIPESLRKALCAEATSAASPEEVEKLKNRLRSILTPPSGPDSGGGGSPLTSPSLSLSLKAFLFVGSFIALGTIGAFFFMENAEVDELNERNEREERNERDKADKTNETDETDEMIDRFERVNLDANSKTLAKQPILEHNSAKVQKKSDLSSSLRKGHKNLKRPTSQDTIDSPSRAGQQVFLFAQEARFLSKVRAILDRDPSKALKMVKEHQKRFPRGKLVEERETLRIRALRKLGRIEEAGQQTKAFENTFPHSGYEVSP